MYHEIGIGIPTESRTFKRAIICPIADLDTFIHDAIDQGEELYFSYYQYDEDIKAHLSERKSVSGYKGLLHLPMVTLDMDRGTNTHEVTHQKMLALKEKITVGRWVANPAHLQVWFSGRGYHLRFPNRWWKPEYQLNVKVKAALGYFFPECDGIYDAARILRAPHTLNTKSGLYKIPLVGNETADEVLELAKKPQLDRITKFDLNAPDVTPIRTDVSIPQSFSISMAPTARATDDSNRTVMCMQTVYHEGGVEGSRHKNAMRLISSWRRSGIPAEGCMEMLRAWAPTFSDYEVKSLVLNVFDKGYRYGCEDEVMKKYCDSRCVFYRLKNYTPKVFNAEQADEHLEANVEQMRHPIFDIGQLFPSISAPCCAGEFILVFADTKMGKSSMIMNLAVSIAPVKVLYLGLEMNAALTYRRFVQIAHNLGKEIVLETYAKGKQNFSDALSHIQIMEVAVNVNDLRRLIAETGVQVVVIDVIDALDHGNNLEDNTRLGELAKALKGLAEQMKVAIIGIHHTSKDGTDMADWKTMKKKPLTIHSGKGPSIMEQKADRVIGIEGDREGAERLVKSLGTRDDADFQVRALFHKATMRFVEQETSSYTRESNLDD